VENAHRTSLANERKTEFPHGLGRARQDVVAFGAMLQWSLYTPKPQSAISEYSDLRSSRPAWAI